MKRREFLGVLSGAVALPLTAGAQQPAKSWRIAYLALLPGENVERPLIRQRLDLAQARAEVPIKASCFCRRVEMAAA